MNNQEAIEIIRDIDKAYRTFTNTEIQALEMAIQAVENIGHLTDRPCSVCEFRKENGCCKWDCVFEEV